jgi:hypothetical protein
MTLRAIGYSSRDMLICIYGSILSISNQGLVMGYISDYHRVKMAGMGQIVRRF